MRAFLFLTAVLVISLMTTQAWEQDGSQIDAEVLDPAFRTLIPATAKLQRVATGFKWTEGPIWMKPGYLLFAEIPSNTIRKWSSGQGSSENAAHIVMQPSGYLETAPFKGPEPGSNGMTADKQGRLTVAGHGRRSVWRAETADLHGHLTVLADHYQGKRLNSPNDLVYRSDGSLYFTDPPYGLQTQGDADTAKELKFNGVYRLEGAQTHAPGAPPDPAKLKLLIRDLSRPNGLVFSPDERFLYVCNSDQQRRIWMRYQVKADGSVHEPKLLYDATSDERKGAPDGMKVDHLGNLYSAGPGGLWVFSAEGKRLGVIHMPEITANLAWGDADGKTLYITASSSVYRLRVNVAGVRPGW